MHKVYKELIINKVYVNLGYTTEIMVLHKVEPLTKETLHAKTT